MPPGLARLLDYCLTWPEKPLRENLSPTAKQFAHRMRPLTDPVPAHPDELLSSEAARWALSGTLGTESAIVLMGPLVYVSGDATGPRVAEGVPCSDCSVSR